MEEACRLATRTPPGPPEPPAPAAPPTRDADLVRRVLAGDPAAFGTLYDRHADRVFRYVHFRVREPETAGDLTHDAFESALKGLPALADPDRFGAWLMRIAHHRVVNHWVAASRHAPPVPLGGGDDRPDAGDDGAADGADAGLASPDDVQAIIERRLGMATVMAEAERLTEAQQHVLGLRFAAGLTLRETSDALGLSEDAVKQLQHRALTQLRKRLGAREGPA